jgi:hypothetical protein
LIVTAVIAADASLVQKIVDDEKKNTEALMEKVTGLLKTLEVGRLCQFVKASGSVGNLNKRAMIDLKSLT